MATRASESLAIEDWVSWGPQVTKDEQLLLCDAQTSGGLLVALPAEQAEAFAARCRERGASRAAVVGTVKPRGAKRLEVVKG